MYYVVRNLLRGGEIKKVFLGADIDHFSNLFNFTQKGWEFEDEQERETGMDKVGAGYRRLLAEVSPDGSIIYKELDGNASIIGIFTP